MKRKIATLAAILWACLGCFCLIRAEAGHSYAFERAWPEVPEGWDFHGPGLIAVDQSGNVFVVDGVFGDRVQKFDSSGKLLSRSRVSSARGIAVDSSANLYVTDWGSNRVHKFDSSWNVVREWGSRGSGDGEFDSP